MAFSSEYCLTVAITNIETIPSDHHIPHIMQCTHTWSLLQLFEIPGS